MSWLKSHWKKIVGAGVAIAGWFVPELAPLQIVGGIVLGSDFQVGTALGTPIGKGAKGLADKLRK